MIVSFSQKKKEFRIQVINQELKKMGITYTISLGDRLEAPDGRGPSNCMDCGLSLSGDDDGTTSASGGQARSGGDSEHGGG
jgi:hypothetical protein